ncbi:MAG TPA: DUF2934 domain-containing protein [Cellvibrio sp.]|nr:DUF2934 domain-containing protein [Cellvibrio sp.]
MHLSNFLVNSSLLIGLVLVGRKLFFRGQDSLGRPSTVNPQMEDNEAYIRELAYQIWESEGWPEGAAERHWEMAVTLSKPQEAEESDR